MLIIPAIDVMDGKCVRLRQGRFDESTVFSDDPVAMAQNWVSQGAQYLHLVDLDGARTGEPQVLDILREVGKLGVPVEIGGGMRSQESIEAALQAGAERIIVGTRAIQEPEFAKEIIREFGNRIVIDIAAQNGLATTHGWQEVTPRRAVDVAQEMEQWGAVRILFTDVAHDGALEGPNFPALEEMIAALNIPVLASGGITRIDDIRRLTQTGAEGCIIGRALYTGDIVLSEAIKVSQLQPTGN